MSLVTIGIVAALAWVVIMFLSTGGKVEERNDIRGDGTNVLLSSVGYMVVLYACMHYGSTVMSWAAFIVLGILALIPFAGSIALVVNHESSGRRILSSFIASIVPIFIDICILINCILK